MALVFNKLVALIDRIKKSAGIATIETHSIYLAELRNGAVIDLGANVGDFSAAMAMRGLPCYAVEPDPALIAKIPTHPNIHKFNYAISDNNAPVSLFLSSNPECNSVQEIVASIYGKSGLITCPGVTFESFLDSHDVGNISLLKIDIEGSEERLFASTSDRVLQSIPQITVEFHDFISGCMTSGAVQRITRRLRGLGFVCIPFSYLYPPMTTADFLYVQRKHLTLSTVALVTILRWLLIVRHAKSRLSAPF
jgi:FkbM family methyltransferase